MYKRCGLTEDISRTFEKIGMRYHFGKQGGLFAGRMKQYIDDIDRMLPSMRSKYRGIAFEVV